MISERQPTSDKGPATSDKTVTKDNSSFFGWLGRQVGHVKKAVQSGNAAPAQKVIYRKDKIEEHELPDQPGTRLRRTVIDEVIVQETAAPTRANLPPASPDPSPNE